MIFWNKNEISNFEASLWWVFPKYWEPVINISWLKYEQVKVCVFTLESRYPYFFCNLRHNVMPYMYSEMQNKLSKTRESPLESMGQIISSRCPILIVQVSSAWEVLLDKLIFLSFYHSLPLIDQLANLHFHFTSVPRCTPMTD